MLTLHRSTSRNSRVGPGLGVQEYTERELSEKCRVTPVVAVDLHTRMLSGVVRLIPVHNGRRPRSPEYKRSLCSVQCVACSQCVYCAAQCHATRSSGRHHDPVLLLHELVRLASAGCSPRKGHCLYEHRAIDLLKGEQRSEEYLRVNPLGQVPALVDGDLVLTQSMAALEYLEELRPQTKLLPEEPAAAGHGPADL